MERKFFNIIPGESDVAILLYGDIGENRRVDSGRVVSELLTLAAQYKKIDVRINSNGGDVFNGIAIYNALRTSKADITIYVDGVAASMAGIIALCGKPLYMSPYAKIMLHSVSGGAYGNVSDLRSVATMMESLEKDLSQMIAGRCGMSAEAVRSKYFDETDHWLSAQEAVNMKLADGIYELPDVPGLPMGDLQSTQDIYNYFNNRLLWQPQNQNNMSLIDQIRAIPTFAGITDEAGIVAKVRELDNKAAGADALQKANDAYKQKIADAESAEIKAVLDKAVSDGKITSEQLPTFTNLMKTDRKNTEALLASMKPAPKNRMVNFIGQGGVEGLAGKSWDELDKEGKLGVLKETDKELFMAKFKEKFGVDYKE